MYDLFTRLLNRLKKDTDMEGIMHLEECIELWTDMEIEEMEQDKKIDDNIRKMQNECGAWLDELHLISLRICSKCHVQELGAYDGTGMGVFMPPKQAKRMHNRASEPYQIQLSKICKEAHEALSNMKQALLDSSREKDVTSKIEADLTRHLEATNAELHGAQQEMKRLSKVETASILQKAKSAAIEEMKQEMQLVVARSEQQAEIEELKSQVSRLSEELWRERARSAEEQKDREKERERAEGSECEADYMIQAVLHQERAEKGDIARSNFERDSGLLMMDMDALRTENKMLKKKQRGREQAKRILQQLLRSQLAYAFGLYLNRVIETRCKRETCRRVLLRMQHQALAGAYDMFFETVEQLKAHRQIVEKVMARWRAPLLMRVLVAWHRYVEVGTAEGRDSKERMEEKEEQEKANKREEWGHTELAQLKEEEWDQKKTMDSMILKEIYQRDMDTVKLLYQTIVQDVQRERDAERVKLEGEKNKIRKLEEDRSKRKEDLNRATTEGVIKAEGVHEDAGRKPQEQEEFPAQCSALLLIDTHQPHGKVLQKDCLVATEVDDSKYQQLPPVIETTSVKLERFAHAPLLASKSPQSRPKSGAVL